MPQMFPSSFTCLFLLFMYILYLNLTQSYWCTVKVEVCPQIETCGAEYQQSNNPW